MQHSEIYSCLALNLSVWKANIARAKLTMCFKASVKVWHVQYLPFWLKRRMVIGISTKYIARGIMGHISGHISRAWATFRWNVVWHKKNPVLQTPYVTAQQNHVLGRWKSEGPNWILFFGPHVFSMALLELPKEVQKSGFGCPKHI